MNRKKTLIELATEVKLKTDMYMTDVKIMDGQGNLNDQLAKINQLVGLPEDLTEEQVIEKVYKIVDDKFRAEENAGFDELIKKMLVAHGSATEENIDKLYEARKGYVVANYIKHCIAESSKNKEEHKAPFTAEENNYCQIYCNLEIFVKDQSKRCYYVDENGDAQLTEDFKKTLDQFKGNWSQEVKDNKAKGCCGCGEGECHCHDGECQHEETKPENA